MSNWILTLGHHRLDQLEWCFEHNRLFCTSGAKTAFLWQHYPLPNKAQNELRIRSLVEKYPEVVFFDAGVGLGAGGGIRYLCQKLRLDDSDKVIIRDPDENVAALGWDTAIFDAMSDPLYPIIGVLTPHIKLELEDRGFSIESANGYPIYVPKQPCMMSVCGFRCDWWLPSGGFRDSGRDYGGTEVHTWPMLGMTGKKMGYLRQYWACNGSPKDLLVDPIYCEWKIQHAHRGYDGSFEDYLRLKGIPF